MIKVKRFLDTYAYILIILFVGCLYTLSRAAPIKDYPIYYEYFGITISLWYLMTGIAILIRQAWGYYLFKSFLYVLLLAFPIGTIISLKSLSYMNRNNAKGLFTG